MVLKTTTTINIILNNSVMWWNYKLKKWQERVLSYIKLLFLVLGFDYNNNLLFVATKVCRNRWCSPSGLQTWPENFPLSCNQLMHSQSFNIQLSYVKQAKVFRFVLTFSSVFFVLNFVAMEVCRGGWCSPPGPQPYQENFLGTTS